MPNTLNPPPPPPPPPFQFIEPEWETYRDPTEHAFSMDVPKGWLVQGGVYRFGYIDVRSMIDLRSPDGKIVVRINDASVPAYQMPSPYTPPPGQPYVKPGLFQMIVSPYVEGKRFAEMYAPRRFGPVCQQVTPLPGNWHITPSQHLDPPGGRSTEGRVVYSCQTAAGPRIAAVYARTTLFQHPGTSFWTVFLISVLETADQADYATAVITHMVASIKKNPQWEAYQNQMTQMAIQALNQQTQQSINQLSAVYHNNARQQFANLAAGQERFRARMDAQDRQHENFCDILVGQANMIDPMSGQAFKVSTGPYNNYYRNGRGDIVNANVSPGIGFHQINPFEK